MEIIQQKIKIRCRINKLKKAFSSLTGQPANWLTGKLIAVYLFLLLSTAICVPAYAAKSGGDYEIKTDILDSGGSPSRNGGDYTLKDSIAQPGGVTTISGGSYEVKGGYLPGLGSEYPSIANISLTQVGEKDNTKIQINYTICDDENRKCNFITSATQVQWSTSSNGPWTNATISGTTSNITATEAGTAHSDLYWNCGNIGSIYYVQIKPRNSAGLDALSYARAGSVDIEQPKYDISSGLFKCFIATAAYTGNKSRVTSHGVERINTLCQFRDERLLTNPLGRDFVKLYYRFSPPVARFISDKESLKAMIRNYLKPIVWGAKELIRE